MKYEEEEQVVLLLMIIIKKFNKKEIKLKLLVNLIKYLKQIHKWLIYSTLTSLQYL